MPSFDTFLRYPQLVRRRKNSNINNNAAPDPFPGFGAPMAGGFPANSSADRYPSPSASVPPVNNHGPATPPTSLSAVRPATTQEAPSAADGNENNIATTSSQIIMQGAGQQSALIQPSSSGYSSSVSTSSSSSTIISTIPATLLRVPPPSTQDHHPAQAQSPSFLLQTFSDTETTSASNTQPSTVSENASAPIHLSPTAVGLLISLAGFIFLVVAIFIIRCMRRQIRNRRYRLHQHGFDFPNSAERGAWGDSDDGMTINEKGGSPSTIFGGKERTGLTPLPSWTTFYEGGGDGSTAAVAPSPYPLGLLPPPVTIHHAPSLRGRNGVGLGVVNDGANSKTMLPRQQGFSPPTIMITSSTPRSTTHIVPQHGLVSSSSSGISTCGSFNRVSVYDHPEHGAQLVKPPRLAVVNDEAGMDARYSGWSSWDDSVGVELGVTMDRKHPAPLRRKIRTPHGKGRFSAIKSSLAPVPEVSDSSDADRHGSRLHPNGTLSRKPRIPTSPLSSKSSPGSLRSLSPRAANTKPVPPLLYDLPQFDNLSPILDSISRGDSTKISGNYQPLNPSQQRATPRSRRRSRNSQKGKLSPSMAVQKASPTVSDAISETYEYVNSYGCSDDDKSEAVQVRRRSKRINGTTKKNSSPRSGTSPPRRRNLALAASPGVHASVGALMMAAYGEEGSLVNDISSPSISTLNVRGKKGARKVALGDATNVDSGVGLGVSVSKGRQPPLMSNHSTNYPKSGGSSQHQYQGRQGEDGGTRGKIQAQYRDVPPLPPPGMPSLQQMKLMQELPDYRSPTYSLYGMYRDTSKVSPLQMEPYAATAEFL